MIRQIPTKQVAAEIQRKCAQLEQYQVDAVAEAKKALSLYQEKPHLFSRKPTPEAVVEDFYRQMIDQEKTYYARVRLVKLKSGWKLRYGGERREGTGPFSTRKKAIEWFLNGGR